MSQLQSYKVRNIQSTCLSHGLTVLPEILEVLSNKRSSLEIDSLSLPLVIPIQLDNDFIGLSWLLQQDNSYLASVSITQQRLSSSALRLLSAGVELNSHLQKLILSSDEISSSEGVFSLVHALQSSASIQVLNLSENKIDDESMPAICELLSCNTSLVTLDLSKNYITEAPSPQVISSNSNLQQLDLSYNALTFESTMDLLETLNINTSLKFLNLKGVLFDGPAPLKENSSGHLAQGEALILKLANVLRNSNLKVLGIELDIHAEVQLAELENTLVKYNRTLVSIISDNISWELASLKGRLYGICRALWANTWILQGRSNREVPHEIQDIVKYKSSPQTPSESNDLGEAIQQVHQMVFEETEGLNRRIESVKNDFQNLRDIESRLRDLENSSSQSSHPKDIHKLEFKFLEQICQYESSLDDLERRVGLIEEHSNSKQLKARIDTLENRVIELEKCRKENEQLNEMLEHALERIEKLEKAAKPKISPKKKQPIKLPEFSESLVMGALLEKVQSQRKIPTSFDLRSQSPYANPYLADSRDYLTPSKELQECMKARGISFSRPASASRYRFDFQR